MTSQKIINYFSKTQTQTHCTIRRQKKKTVQKNNSPITTGVVASTLRRTVTDQRLLQRHSNQNKENFLNYLKRSLRIQKLLFKLIKLFIS